MPSIKIHNDLTPQEEYKAIKEPRKAASFTGKRLNKDWTTYKKRKRGI